MPGVEAGEAVDILRHSMQPPPQTAVRPHNGVRSQHKKEGNPTTRTAWTDLAGTVLSELSQRPCDAAYRPNPKVPTPKTEQAAGCRRRGGVGAQVAKGTNFQLRALGVLGEHGDHS